MTCAPPPQPQHRLYYRLNFRILLSIIPLKSKVKQIMLDDTFIARLQNSPELLLIQYRKTVK